MFNFINNIPYADLMDVLMSLYLDIKDFIDIKKDPQKILLTYVEQFPEFTVDIVDEYIAYKKAGLFNIEKEKEIIQNNKMILYTDAFSLQDIIDNLSEIFYKNYMLNKPGGKLFLEIEQRIEYLDKYYLSKKFGFNPSLKDW